MAMKNLAGFGKEMKKITYKDKMDWLINMNDCENLWKAQPTYLISQSVLAFGGLVTLIHALRRGGRWPWLWLTAFLYGILIEISLTLPDTNFYWHSQAPIMFFAHKIPLHVLLAYPAILYAATYGVARLYLSGCSEPFAVGLVTLLFRAPLEIVGVKFLHKTWHDTNPIIADRHYWVPWSYLLLQTIFSFNFIVWFNLTYNLFKSTTKKWQSRGFFRELRTSIMTLIVGVPTSYILYDLLNHPLNSMLRLHSEVVFFLVFAIFLGVAWSGDRTPKDKRPNRVGPFDWLLILFYVLHFATYLTMTVIGHPEAEVSMGLHEPIGPCGETTKQETLFQSSMKYRKYLCLNDFHEDYYTFACLGQKKPESGSIWYTICGTPLRNRNEYITVIGTISFVALVVLYNFYFRNVTDDNKAVKDVKKSKKKAE